MKTKKEIVDNWLPRYTGTALEDFGEHVLLTNFGNYLDLFSAQTGAPIVGRDRPMPNATAAKETASDTVAPAIAIDRTSRP